MAFATEWLQSLGGLKTCPTVENTNKSYHDIPQTCQHCDRNKIRSLLIEWYTACLEVWLTRYLTELTWKATLHFSKNPISRFGRTVYDTFPIKATEFKSLHFVVDIWALSVDNMYSIAAVGIPKYVTLKDNGVLDFSVMCKKCRHHIWRCRGRGCWRGRIRASFFLG